MSTIKVRIKIGGEEGTLEVPEGSNVQFVRNGQGLKGLIVHQGTTLTDEQAECDAEVCDGDHIEVVPKSGKGG